MFRHLDGTQLGEEFVEVTSKSQGKMFQKKLVKYTVYTLFQQEREPAAASSSCRSFLKKGSMLYSNTLHAGHAQVAHQYQNSYYSPRVS